MTITDELLTADEAAAKYKIHPKTFHQYGAARFLGVTEAEIVALCRDGLLKYERPRRSHTYFVEPESRGFYGLHIGRVLSFFTATAQAMAWKLTRWALADGTLKRLPCEVCGDPAAQSHHDNYAFPLDVRWLCHKHHRQHHREQDGRAAQW